MKSAQRFAICLLLLLVPSSSALANTLVWTQNQSPQAVTDDITAAFRNPAGMSFMEPGFHANLTGQVLHLDMQSTATALTGNFAGNKYGPKLTAAIPYLSAAWVGEEWTLFGYTLISSGSPDAVSYDPGLLDLRAASQGNPGLPPWMEYKLDALSAVFTYNFGVSYNICNVLAISVVGVLADRTDEVEATIPAFDSSAKLRGQGHGMAAQLGLALRPDDHWFFSATAKTPIIIEPHIRVSDAITPSDLQSPAFQQQLQQNALAYGIAQGALSKTELPWIFTAGARYDFDERFSLLSGVLVELWNSTYDDRLRNLLALSLGAEYAINEWLDVTAGIGWSNAPYKKEYAAPTSSPTAPVILSVGAGAEVLPGHKFDVGVTYSTRSTWDLPEQGYKNSRSNTLLASFGYSLHI